MRYLGYGLMIIGAVVLGVAGYNMTLGEQAAIELQQKAAEVVPLVSADTATGELEIGEIFAKLSVPRFGENYIRNIAQGTSLEKVLNTIGVGHYSASQMPGEVGNFALAGHRAGNGGPMRLIDKLVSGDVAIVETATTKFTYRFIESKIVAPTEVGVIKAVPEGLTGAVAGGKYLTLTTCTPIYINTERYVAWFELESESPIR
jgi:sortase A